MLEGKTALITGASSGIGEATAKALAEEGVHVALTARSREKLERLADSIGENHDVKAVAIPADVTEEKEVKSMVEQAVNALEHLDIVVANAGLGMGDSVKDMESETFHTMMDVNCDGMFFTARETVPYLEETEGNLIFLGSFAGQYPRPGNPVYAATKWWTRGFGLSLSGQVEDVAVTVVNPTEVRTDFASEDGESFAERFEEGEVTEPGDIAEAIVHAATQEPPNEVSEVNLYRRNKFSGF